MFLLLLVNDSLISAVNPLYVFLVIKKIGRRYLLLYCFTSLMLTIAIGTAYLVQVTELSSWSVAPILFYTLLNYYLIIVYHLLGYVMLQYHEELDVEIDYVTFLRCNHKEQIEQNIAVPIVDRPAAVP